MIVKSFFRNRIVKIYIIILTIVISSLFVLSSFINYYQKLQDELFVNRNIIIATSKEDIYKKLAKIKNLTNVKKRAVLLPDKTYNIIVDSQYTLTDSSGNVLDEYKTDEKDYEFKITWDKLFVSDFDYILVSSSDDNRDYDLNDNEILIGLPTIWKDYFSEYPEFYLNKNVGFKTTSGEQIEFKIIDLYESHFPQLIVSSALYDKLIKQQSFNTYIMNALSYSESNDIVKKINTFDDNSEFFGTTFECSYEGFESNTISSIDDLIGVLKLVSYIIVFIFVILIFIIIKNLLSDLNKNVQLEKKLGFSKKRIKINIAIRLLSLLIGSACLSLILSLIIVFAINCIFKLDIILFNYQFFIKIYLIVCLITILTVFFKKN